MAKTKANVQSGNRVLIVFDGTVVGLAQSARMADDYAPDPASGIGDIHVQEYVPTMARHTVNLQQMQLKNESLRSKGLLPENGDAMLRGVVFDILVQDKDSGKVLRKYIDASYASGDLDVSAHRIVSESAMFYATDVAGVGL